ncbi:MAG: helix-hairpin-helix domain-containing protein [Abitibacteriaceae bacterium]|nr:helix-hairpin-helix domain-containing protein [Abditibacteriaceae bacterium]
MAQAQTSHRSDAEAGLPPGMADGAPLSPEPTANGVTSHGSHNPDSAAQFLTHDDGSTGEEPLPSTSNPATTFWLRGLLALILFYAIFYIGSWSSSKSTRPPLVGPFTSNSVSNSTPPVIVHVAGHVKHPGVYQLSYNARIIDAITKAGGPLPDADVDALNLAAWVEDGTRIEVPAQIKASSSPAAPLQAPGKVEASTSSPPSPTLRPTITIAKRSPSQGKKIAPSLKTTVHSAIPHATTPSGKESKKIAPEYLAQHPVNINTATATELEGLPGIGPAMAQKIIAYRQETGRFQAADDLRNVKGIGEKKMEKLQPLVSVK